MVTRCRDYWASCGGRNPADREAALVGQQIAARALSDLAGKLLHTASAGIEGVTLERTHLHL